MKLNRNAWWVQKLGTPDNWCLLAWAMLWRLVLVGIAAVTAYWYLVLVIGGNWEIIKYFAGADNIDENWVAGGIAFDFFTVYLIGCVAFVKQREIEAWVGEHCPKIEYEG